MRIFSTALLLTVTSCNAEPVIENKVTSAKPDDRIECAIGSGSDFASACAIERGEGTSLVVRHNDGGFRRLTLTADGIIDTSDGADAILAQPLNDGRTEITIGENRYRLPATL
jgi:hypothetical protein